MNSDETLIIHNISASGQMKIIYGVYEAREYARDYKG
jgi:hypothetical protein